MRIKQVRSAVGLPALVFICPEESSDPRHSLIVISDSILTAIPMSISISVQKIRTLEGGIIDLGRCGLLVGRGVCHFSPQRYDALACGCGRLMASLLSSVTWTREETGFRVPSGFQPRYYGRLVLIRKDEHPYECIGARTTTDRERTFSLLG